MATLEEQKKIYAQRASRFFEFKNTYNLSNNPDTWYDQAKEKGASRDVLDAIPDAQQYVAFEKQSPKPEQTPIQNNPYINDATKSVAELVSLPFGLFVNDRPEVMEQQGKYQKIRKQLLKQKEKEWKKKNPKKNFWQRQDFKKSDEYLSYVYGSLEENKKSQLDNEAEKQFRDKHKKIAKDYNDQGIKINKKGEIKKYKKSEDDPNYHHLQSKIYDEYEDRLHTLSKNPTKQEKDALYAKIQQKEYAKWVETHPEKAAQYVEEHKKKKEKKQDKALIASYEAYKKKEHEKELEIQRQKQLEEEAKQAVKNNKTQSTIEEKIHNEPPSTPTDAAPKKPAEIAPQPTSKESRLTPLSKNPLPQDQPKLTLPPKKHIPHPSTSPHLPNRPSPTSIVSNIQTLTKTGENVGTLGRLASFASSAGTALSSAASGVGAAAGSIAGGIGGGGAAIIIGVVVAVIVILVVIIIVITSCFSDIVKSSIPLIGQYLPKDCKMGGPIQPNPGEPSLDISSCTFYRGGDGKNEGLQFGTKEMPALVSEISKKVGVPPAIIAGIMRVESPQAIATKNSSYVTNDYDAKFSKDENGNPVAYGVMQFTPGTFIGTFQRESGELESLFGKKDIRCDTQNRSCTIDPQEQQADTSFFRIYSIKDSITAAAYKVKKDKFSFNGDGPWTEDAINAIATNYYGCLKYGPGGCTSGPFSYGGDLWKSYTNCITTEANFSGWPTTGIITQGPQGSTHNPTFYLPYNYEALDIANKVGTPVIATFNGIVKEVHDCKEEGNCAYGWGGYGSSVVLAATTDEGKAFSAIYGHLSEITVTQGQEVTTGQTIGLMGQTGKVFGTNPSHLHWELRGIPLAPPVIPQLVTPPDCDSDGTRCYPYEIGATPSDSSFNQNEKYYFVLFRKDKKEVLFKGVPGENKKETIQSVFRVNPGKEGETPTPLPSVLGKEYWTIESYAPTPNQLTLPYFLKLDIPNWDKAPYFGPSPYLECGEGKNQQCSWADIGEFGLHGIGVGNNLTRLDGGSSGCIRHSNQVITKLYFLLKDLPYKVRYYITDSPYPDSFPLEAEQ